MVEEEESRGRRGKVGKQEEYMVPTCAAIITHFMLYTTTPDSLSRWPYPAPIGFCFWSDNERNNFYTQYLQWNAIKTTYSIF